MIIDNALSVSTALNAQIVRTDVPIKLSDKTRKRIVNFEPLDDSLVYITYSDDTFRITHFSNIDIYVERI